MKATGTKKLRKTKSNYKQAVEQTLRLNTSEHREKAENGRT